MITQALLLDGRTTVGRVLDGQLELHDIRVQRELVHRVDTAEVVQHEEQQRRTRGDGAVALTSLINLSLRLLHQQQHSPTMMTATSVR